MYLIHDFSRLVRSLINDIKRQKKVAFLFGSAVSCSPDGSGVPGVTGVVDLIKDYLIEKEMLSNSECRNQSLGFADEYQGWFDYLLSVGDQSDVQEVIERAVFKAKDQTGKWVVPESLVYFGKLVGSERFNLNCVLTTNFDPLIQEALKNNSVASVNYYCESNSDVRHSEPYERGVKVLHLHGFWTGDTMHTPSQLETDRRAVTDSIKSILNGAKLYVIGYGGWNDVVRKAIKELIVDPEAKYEVRWCFYDKDEQKLRQDYAVVFDEFSPGLSTNRLQFYKGVDCHSLFRAVHEEISLVMSDELGTDLSRSKKHTEILPLEQVINPQKQLTRAEPKPYKIHRDEPHHTVRLQQQLQAARALEVEQCVHLECLPGSGRLGFLSALIDTLQDRELTYFVTRVDLSQVTSSEQFDEQILKDVGCDIMTLLAAEKMERVLLLVDNLDASNSELCVFAKTLINLAKDSQHGFSVVVLSVNPAQLECRTVHLSELLPEDVKEYIKCNNSGLDLPPLVVERISLLTSSLPLKLDIVRKYLSIMSIAELLEDRSLSDAFATINEGIPSVLHSKLIELSASERPENVKLYSLTKIMSVLSSGHKAFRVKNHFSKYNFEIDDFLRLIDYGFIYSINKPELDTKFVRINPLVRDYILRTSASEDFKQLSLDALTLAAGDKWMFGQVKVSKEELSMLEYQDFAPGNIHTLILSLMQSSIKSDDTKLYKQSVQAAVSYSMCLLRLSFFKQVVNFTRSALSLLSDLKSLNHYKLKYHLAEGLRMLGQRDESIKLLESLVEPFKGEPFFTSSLYESILSALALATQIVQPRKALEYARTLRKLSGRASYSRIVSDQIKTEIEYTGVERVHRLKRLEKQARNHNHIILSNNISLVLARLVRSERNEYLDKVLKSSEGDIYNNCRAVLSKVEAELEQNPNPVNFQDSSLYRQCIRVYRYLFFQRLAELFNRSHAVLWQAANLREDAEQLYGLFRTSSLVWRLSGDVANELKYAEQLRQMPIIAMEQNRECRSYLDGRLIYIQKAFDESVLSNKRLGKVG